MKLIIKKLLSSTMYYSGLVPLIRKMFPSRELAVLMYHKVNRKEFSSQMEYLKKNYNVISEKDAIDFYYKKKKLPKNSILITFDDGYLNNFEIAHPVLKDNSLPAIIFLATKFIGTKKMPWYDKVSYYINNTQKKKLSFLGKPYSLNTPEDRRRLIKKYYYHLVNSNEQETKKTIEELASQCDLKDIDESGPLKINNDDLFMNWDQVNKIKDTITFGAHTHSHPILPNISLKRKKEEIKKSKGLIEKKIRKKCLSFCFPNGDFDDETVKLLEEEGFKLSFTTLFGKNRPEDSPFKIKRISVNINDNKEILATKLLAGMTRLFESQKKKFTVIMLTNYYFPQLGGLTTSIKKLSDGLKKNNIRVKVYPFPYLFRRIENKTHNNRAIHRLFVLIYLFLTTLLFLKERIRSKHVVVHSHSSNFCARSATIGNLFGFKSVHTFRTDFLPEELKQVEKKPFLERVDALSACSKGLAKNSKKKYSIIKNVEAIYNSVIKSDYKVSSKNFSRKKELKILFVGNLLEIKDPMLFIKGMEELKTQLNNCTAFKHLTLKVTIVGKGHLEPEVKEYLEKKKIDFIKLIPPMSAKDLEKIYKQNEVLVLTSKGEGFANVIVEAMNFGLKVVATPVGGVPEIIKDGFSGVLIKERTGKSVAKAVIRALKNKSLEINAKKMLDKRFSQEESIRRHIKLYQTLLFEK